MLPSAVEAERALIGAVLQSPRTADDAAEIEPQHMHDPRHAHVWRAICGLRDRSQPIDAVTVGERLAAAGVLDAIGGFPYLAKLVCDRPATSAASARYADLIHEKAQARELISVLGELLEMGYTDPDPVAFIEAAQSRVFALASKSDKSSAQTMKAIVKASIKAMQDRMEPGAAVTAKTGFSDLDQLLCGWQPGDQVVLGGRSSMGKSALAMALAVETARAGTPVLVFSVEMSAVQLGDRALCSESSNNSQNFRLGKSSRSELDRITMAATRLVPLPIHVDDSSSITVPQIRARVRKWAAEHKRQGLVVVDYLQLVTTVRNRGGNREQEVAEISRQLKSIAREISGTVLALAQVSRECEKRGKNKRPLLSDLRESGSLEQDADVVLFVYRDEYYNAQSKDAGIMEVICAKQRKGPIGTVKLAFDEASGRIGPLAMSGRRGE
jgi:replicative DNA helicase